MENREIKFRGRCVITGNWAYGYYYISKGNHIIRDENDNECIVLRKTVGEYTGLKDKNGKEIYEGDVLKHFHSDTYGEVNSDVYFDFAHVQFRWKHTFGSGSSLSGEIGYYLLKQDRICERFEIIGNIYENPELINN